MVLHLLVVRIYKCLMNPITNPYPVYSQSRNNINNFEMVSNSTVSFLKESGDKFILCSHHFPRLTGGSIYDKNNHCPIERPSVGPILGQFKPLSIFTTNFLEIHPGTSSKCTLILKVHQDIQRSYKHNHNKYTRHMDPDN
jgi:hypothetical protein